VTQEVFDAIRKRRTVRKFADQEVSVEKIDKLVELAMYAPNRLNHQPWHFIVIQDKRIQKQFADFLRIHSYLEDASAVIVACAVPKASTTWALDVSAAVQNLMIGATSMGLGTAWVGSPDTVTWSMFEESVRDSLGIPIDVRVVALVAVGHPDKTPAPHTKEQRFDPNKVHYGRWENRKYH
jgi:nitroreductase